MAETVKNDFLSKNNITYLYKNITTINELTNLSTEQKNKIIEHLINMMKSTYKTLDLNKINNNNIAAVKQQFNDIVIKQTTTIIKSMININSNNNERMNERTFNSVVKPLPVVGNERPTSSFSGMMHGKAPSTSSSVDFNANASADINSRLRELENSRKIGNEPKIPTDVSDWLKPTKVGKQPEIQTSSDISRPLLGYDNENMFSSVVPTVDSSKYNETLSTADRLKQLEMERGMPFNNEPNKNINNLFTQSTTSQSNISNMFNTPPPSQPQYQLPSQPLPQPPSQPPSQPSPQPQYQLPPQPQYQPQYQPSPQSQYQPPPQPQSQQLQLELIKMENYVKELEQHIVFLKNENAKKPTNKMFQLEVNKKETPYDYKFTQIKNICNLKLASYNLPKPVYNIIEDTYLQYIISGNIEKKILIVKGLYSIERLLDKLNNNTDLIFSIDIEQKVIVEIKEFSKELSKENNIVPKEHITFQLLPTYLTYKLGFVNIQSNYTKIVADNIYDLRMPSKLLLYIKNIYKDQPVGILHFNGSSICDIQFSQLVTLNNLYIEFYTEDNILYNFNGLMYELSFVITITSE